MRSPAYGVIEVFSLVLGNILEILYCIIKDRQQEGGRHEPVLIVDDEKAIADLIEMTLEPFGYACRKAYSGEEAADLIGKEHFDLILLDVMLPGVDGFTLMDYIAPTGTPVIFLTAKTAVEDRVRGLRAGAYDYIVKPFAAEELLARVTV